MTRDELLDLFRRSGALLEGHFRLTSGLHSSGYLQCALVLQHPQHAEALGRAIADRTRSLRPTARAVAGARRRRDRTRGRPRARRARALRRAAGRRARRCGADSSSPKTIACSSSRTCSPPAARRARRCRWPRRPAARWSAPRRSSIAAAGRADVRRAVRVAARDRPADLRARQVSAVRAGAAGGEAGVAAGG